MQILLLEPFYTSSHKQWTDGIIKHSTHSIDVLTLSGRHWKWRMHNAAVSLVNRINQIATYDLIICSDLIDVGVFKGLLLQKFGADHSSVKAPIITYFHENQITYPWSERDQDVQLKRDNHYGWINFTSALASDFVVFNSEYHRQSFIGALPSFLGQFPDGKFKQQIQQIRQKSIVIHIGLELQQSLQIVKSKNSLPVVLWNHRWEYDKNPTLFFETLINFAQEQIAFKVLVLGERYKKYPEIFDQAKTKLADRILHFGYVESRNEYLRLIAQADILPVTSNQDFFGISAIEGIAAGCYPLLPDRLAFPEHLEDQRYFYSEPTEFAFKLKKILTERPEISDQDRLHISKYDWSNIIESYDSFFENVVDK